VIALPVYLSFEFFEGTWEAVSRHHGKTGYCQWRIVVDSDGSFRVDDTDRELLALSGGNRPFFPSLREAQAWCDRNEGNLAENE